MPEPEKQPCLAKKTELLAWTIHKTTVSHVPSAAYEGIKIFCQAPTVISTHF